MTNPELSTEECEKLAREISRKGNPNCREYWETRYPDVSPKELESLINEYRNKRNAKRKEFRDYWVRNYPDASPEEIDRMWKQYTKSHNSQCIEYWERKYPELSHEEHLLLLENKSKQIAKNRPDNSGINNPAHHSKTTEQERKSRSPMCIEFYERKYPDARPEERADMLEAHKNKIRKKLSDPKNHAVKIEYWLAKGLSQECAENMVRHEWNRRAFTVEHCIAKYGKEEGIRRFRERQEKWMKSLHKSLNPGGIYQSRVSMDLFDDIVKEMQDDMIYEYEYRVGRYSFDFRVGNVLIEFNGDYWHCNPQFHDADFTILGDRKAIDIWEKDEIKYKSGLDAGFKVLVIWENEYNNNREETVQKCIKFINENN